MRDGRTNRQTNLLVPPQGPRGQGKKSFAVAHPIHVSNSHTKFSWISPNGLGDSVTVGQTKGIAISQSLFFH